MPLIRSRSATLRQRGLVFFSIAFRRVSITPCRFATIPDDSRRARRRNKHGRQRNKEKKGKKGKKGEEKRSLSGGVAKDKGRRKRFRTAEHRATACGNALNQTRSSSFFLLPRGQNVIARVRLSSVFRYFTRDGRRISIPSFYSLRRTNVENHRRRDLRRRSRSPLRFPVDSSL